MSLQTLAFIAQTVIPVTSPAPSLFGISGDVLVNLVKVGEFGSAVAMLLLGFYLHSQASNSPSPDISARKSVAKQFMAFAIIFFVVCCVVEIVKLRLDPHPRVNAIIAVPPLNEETYEQYGKINIVRLDSMDQQLDTKHAGISQYVSLHDNSTITIDISSLTAKLKDTRRVIDNSLTSTHDIGPETPK